MRSTGSITTTGGVGITQDMNVGGDVTVTGDLPLQISLHQLFLTGTAPFIVTSTTPVTNLSIGGNAGTVTNGIYTTSSVTNLNPM